MFVHTYPDLLKGTLVKRYKRFFADIELDSGELVTAHCANTGPMTGVSAVGSQVYVSHNPSPKRKLPYSWEIIQVDGIWVGVHTGLPNKVVSNILDRHLLPELDPYNTVRAEVAYGSEKSRIDFVLTAESATGQTQTYVEVKNTTWSQGNLALFPDTETTRGQKHLRELMSVVTATTSAVLLFFINRGDCDRFAPGDAADPAYGKLLREAIAAGVKVLPCRFNVTPQGIEYLGMAKLVIV